MEPGPWLCIYFTINFKGDILSSLHICKNLPGRLGGSRVFLVETLGVLVL